jgi:hypothetical protein
VECGVLFESLGFEILGRLRSFRDLFRSSPRNAAAMKIESKRV